MSVRRTFSTRGVFHCKRPRSAFGRLDPRAIHCCGASPRAPVGSGFVGNPHLFPRLDMDAERGIRCRHTAGRRAGTVVRRSGVEGLILEELGSHAMPENSSEDVIDRVVDGIRSLVGTTDLGVRVFLTDRGGRLRIARTAGSPLNAGGRQTTARRRTLQDRIVRTLERDLLAVSIFPIDRRGDAIGVTEVTATIATLRHRRSGLESLIGRMSAVIRREIEDDTRRRELDLSLAWTSHELRGPLHAVRAWLEHAASISAEASLPIRRATDELSRITGGLESVLSWSAGREHLDERDVDLVGLMRDAVDCCVAETGEDRVVMEGTERLIVRGDPLHLRSAFENLIRNALRYSVPGSKVRVIVEPRDGQPAVEVENEGSGIGDRDRTAIFAPMTRSAGGVGTGLGLYVVGRVVERHGGTIRCSKPKEGMISFELRLPPISARGGALRSDA
jgi:signal transduction histidine kinase